MSNVQTIVQGGLSEELPVLIRQLKTGDPDQAEQAAARLRGLGTDAVLPLLDALGDRKALTVWLDPLFRRFEKPRQLSFKPPEKLFNERIEAILGELGPAALPLLVEGFDHPDFRVREAAARLMARQDRAAIPYLLEALRKPRAGYLPGDALASVGKAAVDPLVELLKREPVGSPAWHAADAALCGIVRGPTLKKVRSKRGHLVWAWVLALVTAAAAFAVGLWAELGMGPAAVLGLVAGYALWVAVLHESSASQDNDTADILIFLLECVTAPFIYKEKLAAYRSSKSTREKLVKKYGLPA